MKKLLLSIACLAVLAVSALAHTTDEKFLVKFADNVDVQKEIDSANAFLAALPSDATLDDGYDTTADGLVFELTANDPAALKALVEVYFPADPNVVAVSYVTDGENEDELNDINESTNDTDSGTDVKGEVSLAKPAPKGGVKVMLASSNGRIASVPSFVIVPEGKTTATFRIHTAKKVAKTAVVHIASHLNGKTLAMSLRVRKH